MGKTQPHRIQVLDGLRGFAALQIMWLHIWQYSWFSLSFTVLNIHVNIDLIPRTGFIAVEIFFFLSAFGFFYPYARYYLEGTEKPKLIPFYLRRFKRLVPSYLLSIILIVLFFNADPPMPLKDFLYHIFTHVFFIHTFSPGTFGSINGVLWFMGVLLQFILVFPLFAFLFKKQPVIFLVGITAVACIYRFLIHLFLRDKLSFYVSQLPGFLDVFACGMLSAYLIVYMRKKIKHLDKMKIFFLLQSVIMVLLFITCFGWVFSLCDYAYFGSEWVLSNRLVLGLILVGFTISSHFSFKWWRRIIANPVFKFLAIISYNLYIWHYVAVRYMFKIKLPPYAGTDPHADRTWQAVFFFSGIVISILIATLVTYFFEKPVMKIKFRCKAA